MEFTFRDQKEKIQSFNKGFLASHLINIGVQLGVLEALYEAKHGITISDLASKLRLHEPFLQVWCETAYCLEILECDGDGRFSFQPFLDELLGNMASLRNVAKRFGSLVYTSGERLKQSPECYTTGNLIQSYTYQRSQSVFEATKSIHRNIDLVFSIIRKNLRVKKMLKEGINFLDIGCGWGGLIIQLAQKYANSTFVGIDPIPYGIEEAQKTIAQLGLADRVTVSCLAGEELEYTNSFELACLLITFHEIPPAIRERALERIYQALKPNGALILIDFAYPEKIEDFRNPDYEKGVLDQFKETCEGVVHLSASDQDALLTKAGFTNIQRALFEGLYIVTAQK
jgi:cyclopropane fatty-acyl-phospholipid synthase-like methyltransferase